MVQYIRDITFILTLVLFSCQPKQQVKNIDQNSDQLNFDTFYQQSKQVSIGFDERLKNANLAYHGAKKASIDSLVIKALLEKTKLHSKLKQQDSAIYFSKVLLDLSIKSNDSGRIGNAYYKLGLYNDRRRQLDSAYIYYNESKKIYEALGDSLMTGKNLLNMAILSSDAASYNQSDEIAIKALSFLKNKEEPALKAGAYNCLAINAKLREEYKEAIYWYQKAIETTNNEKYRLIYWSNAANVYRDLGDYTIAIENYERLLKEEKIVKDTNNYARILDNFAYARWLYVKDTESVKELERALVWRTEQNNMRGQISSHAHLSELYKDIDLTKSRIHAKKAYQLASDINHVDDRLEGLKLLMNSYETVPEPYNTYAKKYIFLADSIGKIRSKLENKFIKIYFDTEQNRDENAALKTVNLQKELQLSQSQQMNTIYIALGVISLISFFSIFIFFRSKHQKEKLQEIYLTETRISKKVHDEVANDLYQVMTSLEKDPQEQEAVLDDLEKVYEKTRDISREYNALDLEHDFNDVLSDLLLGYKNEDVSIISKGLRQVELNMLSITKKIAIYRVVQELMTNMKKHSQASIVIVTFKKVKDKIQITYSDDGVGCNLKKSNGLLNAENRIHMMNGNFTLSSEKNEGFKATILI